VHDGSVAYFDHGDGPAVLFVHGLVGDFTHFEHVATRLVDRGFRVLGVDLPGCGDSHKRRDSHSIPGYARDVLTVMDHLGIDRASLVGHSAGGAVVAEVAYRSPARVERLGLMSSAGLRRYSRATEVLARTVVRPWLLEKTLERLALPLLDLVLVEDNEYTKKFVADALNRPVQPASGEMARVMADLVPELVRATVLDRCHLFDMPVLVVWGDDDKLVPRESVEILRRRVADARFLELAACGHMPMIERPDVVAAELVRFLGGAAESSSRAA
jgi:pimeloyl-ACP methyl ester carboxylesterase